MTYINNIPYEIRIFHLTTKGTYYIHVYNIIMYKYELDFNIEITCDFIGFCFMLKLVKSI